MKVLALSSSRVGTGGFLENAKPVIHSFLGEQKCRIAFIPFASVHRDYETYTQMVKGALHDLPYEILTIDANDPAETIRQADVIMTGGGNTFKLLHDIYSFGLFELIRDKVNNGAPYIGWSAGSNITGLSICTTNDMPIIEPKSFTSFSFFPFQINPHYYNVTIPGFNGETRDERLAEFLAVNPGTPIIGLPEGTALKREDEKIFFEGAVPGVFFEKADEHGKPVFKNLQPGEEVKF